MVSFFPVYFLNYYFINVKLQKFVVVTMCLNVIFLPVIAQLCYKRIVDQKKSKKHGSYSSIAEFILQILFFVTILFTVISTLWLFEIIYYQLSYTSYYAF